MDDATDAPERLHPDLPYPRLFAELIERHTFVAFDVGRVRVYSNAYGEEDSLEELLADTILTEALMRAGFLPFARPATGSYDRVCFDVRGRHGAFDAPIVLLDHEAILSFDRIPKPEHLADGLLELLENGAVRSERAGCTERRNRASGDNRGIISPASVTPDRSAST